MKLCHVSEIKLLIVQIHGGPYESASEPFFKELFLKLTNMGVTKSNCFRASPPLIKWQARTGLSVKERDSGWRNMRHIINPQFILHVGFSQSMRVFTVMHIFGLLKEELDLF
jgi:hypothetical protein